MIYLLTYSAGLELGVHLLVPVELSPRKQIQDPAITEERHIEEHQSYQNQDDSTQVVAPLFESHSEHVQQLLYVDDGEKPSRTTPGDVQLRVGIREVRVRAPGVCDKESDVEQLCKAIYDNGEQYMDGTAAISFASLRIVSCCF